MPQPTTALPEIHTEKQDDLTPLYHVVLLDDDEHTYDYVVEMLSSADGRPGASADR
jgi:ATP-dependent Clp protease adaptor protein ClpS